MIFFFIQNDRDTAKLFHLSQLPIHPSVTSLPSAVVASLTTGRLATPLRASNLESGQTQIPVRSRPLYAPRTQLGAIPATRTRQGRFSLKKKRLIST